MAHDSGYARRFLGLLVKQAREEKEWDQQYLADELDIDIRTLRKIEAGKSNIGYNLLIKIIHTPTVTQMAAMLPPVSMAPTIHRRFGHFAVSGTIIWVNAHGVVPLFGHTMP